MAESNETPNVVMYQKQDVLLEAAGEEILEESEDLTVEMSQSDLTGKYIGERDEENKRHGKGWAIHPNGDQYDGNYRHGQRHGQGLYVFKNGARYFVNYRCGIKSGFGVFYYPDGSKYEGNWKKDLKHGEGTYTYRNGDIYRGIWYKDKRHGLGEYYFAEEHYCFKGTWVDGVRVGPAEIYFKDHSFHGTWDNKCPQGPGFYSFGCKYMLSGYYKTLRDNLDQIHFEQASKQNEELGEEEFCIEDKILYTESAVEGESEVGRKSPSTSIQSLIPKWHCQDLLKYDYSMLPQQPVPLPTSDSEDDICEVSSSNGSTKHPSVHEIEDEQTATAHNTPSTSETSISWSGSSALCASINADIIQTDQTIY